MWGAWVCWGVLQWWGAWLCWDVLPWGDLAVGFVAMAGCSTVVGCPTVGFLAVVECASTVG